MRTMEQLFATICRQYGVTVSLLLGPFRTRNLVAARHALILRISQEFPDKSPAEIGLAVNRHRTTVIQALRKAQRGNGK